MYSLRLFILLISVLSADLNVILIRGIPSRDHTYHFVCNGKGNVLVWRINGEEIAIFNGWQGVGHSIVNTYNSTLVEYNATLLNILTPESSAPIQTSSIDLSSHIYNNSEVQCETDLGRASAAVAGEPGCTGAICETAITPTDSSETVTTSPPSTVSNVDNENCTDFEALQDLKNKSVQFCNDNEIMSFVMNLIDHIAPYAELSDAVLQRLQNITNQDSTSKVVEETEKLTVYSGAINNESSFFRNIIFIFIIAFSIHKI